MAYRIRYEVRRYDRRWMIAAAVAVLAVAVLTRELWYWQLVRYVGEQILGAR